MPLWTYACIFEISWNIPQETYRLEYSNYELQKQTNKNRTRTKYKIFQMAKDPVHSPCSVSTSMFSTR